MLLRNVVYVNARYIWKRNFTTLLYQTLTSLLYLCSLLSPPLLLIWLWLILLSNPIQYKILSANVAGCIIQTTDCSAVGGNGYWSDPSGSITIVHTTDVYWWSHWALHSRIPPARFQYSFVCHCVSNAHTLIFSHSNVIFGDWSNQYLLKKRTRWYFLSL
jgi:hypothetical protein